jgi:hypothetical protein
MGKFEREAKQETARILEAGVAILIVEDWQTRGMLGFVFLVFGHFFSLWLFFMQLLSLLLIFFPLRQYHVELLCKSLDAISTEGDIEE